MPEPQVTNIRKLVINKCTEEQYNAMVKNANELYLTPDNSGSGTGTVTSVRVQATSPVVSSQSTEQTTTLNTTISLANNYGDTKNPYASKTKNYVLAAPVSANGTPSFRALDKADIPLASETAASGGTTTSLVTTGEKYTWNNKQDAISDLSTIRDGASAGATAVQPGDLATVATTGSYNDLSNKPTIPVITDTYSATSSNGMSGKAVASAISNKADKATSLSGYGITDAYTKTEVDGLISSVYKPAGSVAFASLPTLSSNVLGNVYNVTDAFTTTANFVEGAGKSYPAGTNVVVVEPTSGTYKFDVLSGFVDLSGYVPTSRKVNGKALSADITISKSDISLGNVDNTSDLDKPISTATQTVLDTKANNTNIINGAQLSSTTAYFYGTSSTAAATVQKEVSIPSITTLNAGQIIIVQPTVTSTVANSTLKLNNFDAYPMRYNNAAITTSTDSVVWSASFPSIWVFNGTYWVFAGHGLDSNTTYTLNYSVDAGKYTAGSGSYAVSRYSIIGQKADNTWEKITSTSATYSTGTSKTVNTNGFILNQLRYYGTTTNVANGAKIATNTMYEKAASIDMRYSTNCGGTTTWAEGDYIYLVGTIGSDGLFYLDTTTWWTNSLPSTNDGKLYIRLGLALAAAGYTMSFFEDRPVFYHNGTKICEYKIADNKQDIISDLGYIRNQAAKVNDKISGIDITDSGDSLPSAANYSVNDTFLNKTDKKLYTTEAPAWQLNDDVTNTNVNINLITGIATYDSSSDLLEKSTNFTWVDTGTIIRIHFKLTATQTSGTLFEYCATMYGSQKYTFNIAIKNTSELYLNYGYYYSGTWYETFSYKLFDTSIETNTEYYLYLTKNGDECLGTLSLTYYNNNIIETSTVPTQNINMTGWTPKFRYGCYSWLYATSYNGMQIYLADSTGDFIIPDGALTWDSGVTLEDNTQYNDTTNEKTIYYNNNILYEDGSGLPDQSGQSGKYLTTNGTTASWETVQAGPKFLSFTNVIADDWVNDSTYTGYNYKCVLTCNGVTSNDYAQVIFGPAQSVSGDYANVCLTGTNSVTIYSKVNTAVSIPTIIIFGSN